MPQNWRKQASETRLYVAVKLSPNKLVHKFTGQVFGQFLLTLCVRFPTKRKVISIICFWNVTLSWEIKSTKYVNLQSSYTNIGQNTQVTKSHD